MELLTPEVTEFLWKASRQHRGMKMQYRQNHPPFVPMNNNLIKQLGLEFALEVQHVLLKVRKEWSVAFWPLIPADLADTLSSTDDWKQICEWEADMKRRAFRLIRQHRSKAEVLACAEFNTAVSKEHSFTGSYSNVDLSTIKQYQKMTALTYLRLYVFRPKSMIYLLCTVDVA